jgi:hypothetical protein
MDIIGALRQEASKMERQLTAVQGAIAALSGGANTPVSPGRIRREKSSEPKRTISAVARAKMSRVAKLRWTQIKAEQSKSKKTK